MAVKKIPIDKLTVGMYVSGFDRSWLQTSFLTHRFLIKTETQIEKLKQSGVQEVEIDTDKGTDLDGELPIKASLSPTPTPQPEVVAQPVLPQDPEVAMREGLAQRLAGAKQARQELLKSVHTVFDQVASSSSVESEKVKQVVGDIMEKTLDNQAAFLALIRTREFDPALRDHLLSVSTLAIIMGQALGYEGLRLQNLATGALLHDVGLLRLPHYMYRLPHALRKFERTLYESHPQLGTAMLDKNGGFAPEVIRMVTEHHVTPDGLGYPQDVAADATLEESRLVMVLDRYDEMLTGQLTLPPQSPQEALSHLYKEGQAKRLDLTLVSQLIRVIGVYPLYSLVELSSGEKGIVVAVPSGKSHQPIVSIVAEASGQRCLPPRTIDFSHQESGGCTIVTALDPDKEGIVIEDVLREPVAVGQQ